MTSTHPSNCSWLKPEHCEVRPNRSFQSWRCDFCGGITSITHTFSRVSGWKEVWEYCGCSDVVDGVYCQDVFNIILAYDKVHPSENIFKEELENCIWVPNSGHRATMAPGTLWVKTGDSPETEVSLYLFEGILYESHWEYGVIQYRLIDGKLDKTYCLEDEFEARAIAASEASHPKKGGENA